MNFYKKQLYLFIVLLVLLTFTGCSNLIPTKKLQPTAPAASNYDLGITPNDFKTRWNDLADLAKEPTLKLNEVPGNGGAASTTYSMTENTKVIVAVAKEKGKVQDVTLKVNALKLQEGEANTAGKILALIMATVDKEITEQDFTQMATDLGMKNLKPGLDKTVIKRNVGYQLKFSLTTLQIFIKNKDAFSTTTPAK